MSNTALMAAQQDSSTVLMIESVQRGGKLKYHKKKLVLIYSIMRHFADELRQAGWNVDYYREAPDFASALEQHLQKFQPNELYLMEQTEYEQAQTLMSMLEGRAVKIFRHCNFISNRADFDNLHRAESARVTMETFYRAMRRKTGVLMDGVHPLGGAWNFDKENREAPPKNLTINSPLAFPPDRTTIEVIRMVEKHFGGHPGTTTNWRYAVTRTDALEAARDFFDSRLNNFGRYQDAMIAGEPFLNHSLLSPYINTCLLNPLELCREAENRYLLKQAPLNSVEGFIRQLIGWREFVWRVYWRLMPEYKTRNSLNATAGLPDFYYTGKTKMRCMQDALSGVLEHGYAHHIARLMLLGNFALIAGLDPLETNNWFHEMFVDGYDWVMVPNVIGMSLHADGGYVGTKPYAASANYINKMSNYCKGCPYNPKTAVEADSCPFNSLYWDFLLRHHDEFSRNQRMSMILRQLETKPLNWIQAIQSKAKSLRSGGWDI
ncbi:MAG: cryptochrome/photolyase family protein [Candidatus Obscuribacterales bacterium]|nr:cryptochrome/photolyase family protein [Candidatus Obscuribacterales bacterium]